jgi:thioester reductase-like protein
LGILFSSNLTFLEGDVSEANLGLAVKDYNMVYVICPVLSTYTHGTHQLVNNVDIIIHSAWQLDFNMDVKSFEKHIAATRNLVDLAMASSQSAHARVLFTSSIAVARNWPAERGPFPEESQIAPDYCMGSGYGESKFVAEQV